MTRVFSHTIDDLNSFPDDFSNEDDLETRNKLFEEVRLFIDHISIFIA